MLVALLNGVRMIGRDAQKEAQYLCPECGQKVILHKGSKIVHHFKHKPPVNCMFGLGETQLHLQAKERVYDYFRGLGYEADVEVPLEAPSGRLRADVLIKGRRRSGNVAFELQHTPIDDEDVWRRTRGYGELGIPVIWVALFDASKSGEEWQAGLRVRYAPRGFERWVHHFNRDCILYFDPVADQLWWGRFHPYYILVKEKSWFKSGRQETIDAYAYESKRHVNLQVLGPHRFADVRFLPSVFLMPDLGSGKNCFDYNMLKAEPKAVWPDVDIEKPAADLLNRYRWMEWKREENKRANMERKLLAESQKGSVQGAALYRKLSGRG